MRNTPLRAFASPIKKDSKLKKFIKNTKKSVKAQGFSNVHVKGVNWGEGVKELKGTESRQGINVSGINLSAKRKIGKNLSIGISNPAVVYARPTLDRSFVSKFGKTKVLPIDPKVSLTYNIPSKKKKRNKR